MRVEKIEDGKATITIDGNEMVVLVNGLYSQKHLTGCGGVTREKLMNDISALYTLSVYHKMPKMSKDEKILREEGAEE